MKNLTCEQIAHLVAPGKPAAEQLLLATLYYQPCGHAVLASAKGRMAAVRTVFDSLAMHLELGSLTERLHAIGSGIPVSSASKAVRFAGLGVAALTSLAVDEEEYHYVLLLLN